MNKVEKQNEHFGSISEEYYTARQNVNHLFYKKLLFDECLKELALGNNKELQILEPMCGYAEGKKILTSRFGKKCRIVYEGFDYSDILINKVKQIEPDINVYKQDVTTFVPNKKYDVVILLGGLHHVPDYAEDIIYTIYGALKKGGVFINFEPTNNNLFIEIVRNRIYSRNHLFDETTERVDTLKKLNKMYERAGFSLYKQFYPGLLAYILYYNPDAFPYLNIGNRRLVRDIFKMDRLFINNIIGRKFSFCTFSILKK